MENKKETLTMSVILGNPGKHFSKSDVTLTLVHKDSRRAIYEANLSDCSIQGFKIFGQGLPLGNHYHTKKDEIFIVYGSGSVFVQKIDPEGKPVDVIRKRELSWGAIVCINSYTAHTFVLEPGSEMICFSSKPYDEKDKDMLDCKIEPF